MSSNIRIYQRHVTIGDPHITSDNYSRLNILASIFEPLVKRDAGGHFRPCLATSWTLSQDARTWRFELREDVVHHDGKALEAADVIHTFHRLREGVGGELGTQGVFQSYLAGSEMSIEGSSTVQIVTKEPTADLLDLLVDIPILSARAIEQLPEKMIGTGPYVLRQLSQSEVLLEAHTGYWRQVERPQLLTWRAVEPSEDRLDALLAGQADIACDLPFAASQDSALASKVKVQSLQTTVCAAFMLNLFEGHSTIREVRQALNVAIDKDAIIRDVVSGAAVPLNGPITSTHLGFNPATEGFPFDPQKARRLLEEAGFGAGLEITLDIPSTLPDEAPALAKRMSEYYQDVGIEMHIREHQDRPAYAERVRSKQIADGACFDSSPASTFRVLWEKFYSASPGVWWLGYDNPRVNTLIDRARQTAEVRPRKLLYQEAFDLISRDAPWIFLYNPLRTIAISKSVDNVNLSPEGFVEFSGA